MGLNQREKWKQMRFLTAHRFNYNYKYGKHGKLKIFLIYIGEVAKAMVAVIGR